MSEIEFFTYKHKSMSAKQRWRFIMIQCNILYLKSDSIMLQNSHMLHTKHHSTLKCLLWSLIILASWQLHCFGNYFLCPPALCYQQSCWSSHMINHWISRREHKRWQTPMYVHTLSRSNQVNHQEFLQMSDNKTTRTMHSL